MYIQIAYICISFLFLVLCMFHLPQFPLQMQNTIIMSIDRWCQLEEFESITFSLQGLWLFGASRPWYSRSDLFHPARWARTAVLASSRRHGGQRQRGFQHQWHRGWRRMATTHEGSISGMHWGRKWWRVSSDWLSVVCWVFFFPRSLCCAGEWTEVTRPWNCGATTPGSSGVGEICVSWPFTSFWTNLTHLFRTYDLWLMTYDCINVQFHNFKLTWWTFFKYQCWMLKLYKREWGVSMHFWSLAVRFMTCQLTSCQWHDHHNKNPWSWISWGKRGPKSRGSCKWP